MRQTCNISSNRTLDQFGRIDLFASNAGIAFTASLDTLAEEWQRIFRINVLAHVYAAKYALPSMLERGEGYFLNTASAAGIIIEYNALPYTVTKHAAFGFAEWLAATYRRKGIRVSVLAPAGVRTPMTVDRPELLAHAIEVDEVVDKVVAGLAGEHFLISTHGFVDKLFLLKAQDYDAYIRAMTELGVKESQRLSEMRNSPPGFPSPHAWRRHPQLSPHLITSHSAHASA